MNWKTEKGELYSVEECKNCKGGKLAYPTVVGYVKCVSCKDGTITHKVEIEKPTYISYISRRATEMDKYHDQIILKEQLMEACKVEKPEIPKSLPNTMSVGGGNLKYTRACSKYLKAQSLLSQYKHNLEDKAHPIQPIEKVND